ncbi:hypothetical protein U1Q18_025422, partial [Sarracenia purpurea var. burkii]
QRSPTKQSRVVSKATHDKGKAEEDYDPEEGESATSDDALEEVEPEEGISPKLNALKTTLDSGWEEKSTQNPEVFREKGMTSVARISTSPSSGRSPGKFVEAQRRDEEDNEDADFEQEENLTVDNLVLRAALGERALVDEKIRFLREKGNPLPTWEGVSGAKMKTILNQAFPRAVQHRNGGRYWNGGREGRPGGRGNRFGAASGKCKNHQREADHEWTLVGEGKRSQSDIPSSSNAALIEEIQTMEDDRGNILMRCDNQFACLPEIREDTAHPTTLAESEEPILQTVSVSQVHLEVSGIQVEEVPVQPEVTETVSNHSTDSSKKDTRMEGVQSPSPSSSQQTNKK